jgi:hypothetical protein
MNKKENTNSYRPGVNLPQYILATEVNLNRLRTGTLQRASSARLTQWRESFVMNADAVSYELSMMINALLSGAKNYFENPNLKFKKINVFGDVFVRTLEFNELFSTRRFHVDTRLFYRRLNEFTLLYNEQHKKFYNTPEKIKEKRREKATAQLREQVNHVNSLKRYHFFEAEVGNIKICRLFKILDDDRLEDVLYSVFGPKWRRVVESSLNCTVKDVLIEKTREVVLNQGVSLEELD